MLISPQYLPIYKTYHVFMNTLCIISLCIISNYSQSRSYYFILLRYSHSYIPFIILLPKLFSTKIYLHYIHIQCVGHIPHTSYPCNIIHTYLRYTYNDNMYFSLLQTRKHLPTIFLLNSNLYKSNYLPLLPSSLPCLNLRVQIVLIISSHGNG